MSSGGGVNPLSVIGSALSAFGGATGGGGGGVSGPTPMSPAASNAMGQAGFSNLNDVFNNLAPDAFNFAQQQQPQNLNAGAPTDTTQGQGGSQSGADTGTDQQQPQRPTQAATPDPTNILAQIAKTLSGAGGGDPYLPTQPQPAFGPGQQGGAPQTPGGRNWFPQHAGAASEAARSGENDATPAFAGNAPLPPPRPPDVSPAVGADPTAEAPLPTKTPDLPTKKPGAEPTPSEGAEPTPNVGGIPPAFGQMIGALAPILLPMLAQAIMGGGMGGRRGFGRFGPGFGFGRRFMVPRFGGGFMRAGYYPNGMGGFGFHPGGYHGGWPQHLLGPQQAMRQQRGPQGQPRSPQAADNILKTISQRESGGRNLAPWQNGKFPSSHASGYYQIQPATWRAWAASSGDRDAMGYPEAYLAPREVQDRLARWALMTYGPNAGYTWRESGVKQGRPYPEVARGGDQGAPDTGSPDLFAELTDEDFMGSATPQPDYAGPDNPSADIA